MDNLQKYLKDYRERAVYWKTDLVQDEVYGVYRQTLGSPSFVPPNDLQGQMAVRNLQNWFMYIFIKTGDLAKARKQCESIGKTPSKYPWAYFGSDPVKVYEAEVHSLGVSLGDAAGGATEADNDDEAVTDRFSAEEEGQEQSLVHAEIV